MAQRQKKDEEPPRYLVTTDEAARTLGISPQRVRDLIRENQLGPWFNMRGLRRTYILRTHWEKHLTAQSKNGLDREKGVE